jgi:hypothetical protein
VLAQVVLLGHQHRQRGDGQWDVVATVVNQGGAPATAIVAAIRFLDAGGQVIGSGSATMAGPLAPRQQGTLNAVLSAEGIPVQLAFDLQWQSIREVPAPTPAAQATGAPRPPSGSAAAVPPPPTMPVYGRVEGSSPNSVPSNPNALPRGGRVGNPGQVPPPPTAAPTGQ